MLSTVGELADWIEQAKTNYENYNYETAISYLSKIIDITTLSESLREMRANSYLQFGDKEKVDNDIGR